jgi:hypothetical protein
MSKNTGRSYHAKKTNRLVNALNSMTLETVMDWLYRSKFALEDGEPLSLKQYLIEIKEVIKAEERIAEEVAVMSDKDKERRRLVLVEEKTEGVGQLIWRA